MTPRTDHLHRAQVESTLATILQFARMESASVFASVDKNGQSCASNYSYHGANAEHIHADLDDASCRMQRTRGGYSAYEALRCVGVKPFPDSRGPHEHDPTPNSSGNAQAQLYATVSEGR